MFKNQIYARSATLKPDYNISHEGVIRLNGEFTYDFGRDKDRERWFAYFEKDQGKKSSQDEQYAGMQLSAKNYMENYQKDPIFLHYMPQKLMGSPRTYLYDALLQQGDLVKKHLFPALRNAGYFNPITTYLEEKFFTFENKSFDLDTIEIPWDYAMRKIFRVKYAMTFDLQKYLEYIIVQKRSRWMLNLYPDLRIRLIFSQRFPSIFMGSDARAFQRAIEPILPKIFAFNTKVLTYAYDSMKVRLDRTDGFQCRFAPNGDIDLIPNNNFEFIWQLLAGKLNILSGKRPNASFQIQSINKDFIKQRGLGSYLMYFLVFYYLYGLFRRVPTMRDIERAMLDLRTGRLRLRDL